MKCTDLTAIIAATATGAAQSDELTSILVSAVTAIFVYLAKLLVGKVVKKLPPADE